MRKSRKRVLGATALLLSALALSAWLAAPSLIRDEVRKEAARLGVEVQVGSVEIGLKGVVLRDVRAESAFFPDQRVEAREVDVRLEWFNVRAISVRGGSVRLSGPWRDLRDRYARWRSARGEGSGRRSPSRSLSLSLSLDDFRLEWEEPLAGYRLKAEAVSALREGALSVRAGSVLMEGADRSLSVRDLEYAEGDSVLRARSIEVAGGGGGTGKRSPVGTPLMDRILSIPEVDVGVKTSQFSASWAGKELRTGELEIALKKPDGRLEASLRAKDVSSPFGSYQELSVVLEAVCDGDSVRMKLEAGAGHLETSHPALTGGKVGLGHLHFRGGLMVGPDRIDVDESVLEIGTVPVRVRGEYAHDGLSGQAGLTSVPCQYLLDSVPEGMARRLRGMELKGVLSMDVQVQVGLPDRKDPSVRMSLKNGCKVTSVPEEFDASKLKSPFKYTTYGQDGRPGTEKVSGPGSMGWVPLQLMSRFVPICIRTMEDPGFLAHSGFHVEAIENSMKENIRTGRLVRGASTLSMQLAKNLWLQREKTASRKLQEAFLTVYLEQELTKEQILELYANVVEFGPDVYGIGAAARHYFGTHPVNLTLGQSLFLASVLPRPTGHYFLADGKLTPGRAARMRGVMKAMWARGIISEDEYQEGVREVLAFGSPSTSSSEAQEEIPVAADGIDPESWD